MVAVWCWHRHVSLWGLNAQGDVQKTGIYLGCLSCLFLIKNRFRVVECLTNSCGSLELLQNYHGFLAGSLYYLVNILDISPASTIALVPFPHGLMTQSIIHCSQESHETWSDRSPSPDSLHVSGWQLWEQPFSPLLSHLCNCSQPDRSPLLLCHIPSISAVACCVHSSVRKMAPSWTSSSTQDEPMDAASLIYPRVFGFWQKQREE